MQHVLSAEELYMHLNMFRQTLKDFNFTHIGNLRFLNLESIWAYMETIENNPFKRQYNELESILDTLQPYLPFLSQERARTFLITIATITNDEEIEALKSEYHHKLRLDFINVARKTSCDREWKLIMDTCEKIRRRKEESYLH